MRYDPAKQHRRSIRLKGYDYTGAGAYFVTICTQRRQCLLGDPVISGIIAGVWDALPLWFPTIALDEFVVMPNHVHLTVWLQSTDPNVGATLAVAPDTANVVGATLAVTPDTANVVGATLVVAPNPPAPNAAAPHRAGASPAPTTHSDWIIPLPESVNLKPALGDVIGAFKSLVFTVYLDWIKAHDPTRRAKFWQRNYYEHIIRNERELHAIRKYIRDNPLQWELDRDNLENIRHLPPPTRMEDYLNDIQYGE